MSAARTRPVISELGRVHFIGLGGAGMSAVARILLGRGIRVSGSDSRDTPGLRALEALGATVTIGQSAANVATAQTVVVSTAIRESNVELAQARLAGLRVLHRSVALASAMEGQRVVAVAGTHGKTTTTAMTTVMLQSAGLDPSFAIGGDVSSLGVNAAFASGGVFVAEADESDGSFLNYSPEVIIVTNVEADHLDYYGSAEAVHSVFDQFVRLLPPAGLLVACADDAGSAALARRAGTQRRVRTYGYSAGADVQISETRETGSASASTLSFSMDGIQCRQELALNVPGRHNILNAAAAFTVGCELGAAPARAADGLTAFSGAARRFEFKGEGRGVRVFDDYAHHPTEVAAALRAARTVAGDGAVHVLFQPHLFSRTREFAAEFALALALADSVAVLDIYPAREDPIPGVTSALITDRLTKAGAYFGDVASALRALAGGSRTGDVILTVGAGDVTQYGVELVELLSSGAGAEAPDGA